MLQEYTRVELARMREAKMLQEYTRVELARMREAKCYKNIL